MIALEVLPLYEAEARTRQGTRTDLADDFVADLPQSSAWERKSRVRAAEAVGVSGRAVAQAKRIAEHAPDLVDLVDDLVALAELHGDPAAAARIRRLRHALDAEASSLAGLARGAVAVVARPGPPGATVGWRWRHDTVTRAARACADLPVPEATP